MTCSACQRINLPGGVRCIYCGTHLPAAPDFDLGAPIPPPATAAAPTNSQPRRAGLVGALLLLAVKAKSLLSLLKFGKIVTTLSSMLVFIWADALIFGWKFGVGIALCILVHEMGHVVVNWRKGLKQTAPMFIPFVGAVIFIKQFPNDPTVQSESGAGGPAAGMLAALVCLLIGKATGSVFWLALANVGFLINLFNLLPFPPLDGSHISAVFSPRVWSFVLITMLLVAIKLPSPMLWLILLVGFLFRLGRSEDGRHQLAAPSVRIRMAAIYLFLCLGLAYGAQYTMDARPVLYGRPAASRTRTDAVDSSYAGAPRSTITRGRTVDANATGQTRSESFSSAQMNLLLGAIIAALLTVAFVFWTITALLSSNAAAMRFTARNLGLVAAGCGGLAALLAALYFWHPLRSDALPLLGAYFAASAAALVYAGYQAAHQSGRSARPTLSTLTARGLAWAAGAAAVVAYACDDWTVAAVTALCVVLFYLRNPWMAASLAGSLAERIGDIERSIKLRERALRMRPPQDDAARLRLDIARLNIALARGGAALAALQANSDRGVAPSITDLFYRASAFVLLDRYDEALDCCERILQTPTERTGGDARLLLAHTLMANIARFRDWNDEALAQTDWCLQATPKTARLQIATLQAMRASALAADGQTDTALEAGKEALKSSREPRIEAHVANVRAQAALRMGEGEAAERETARALQLMRGHLESLYWRGLALIASGRYDPGRSLLASLASEYSQEHWGVCARQIVTASAGSQAASARFAEVDHVAT